MVSCLKCVGEAFGPDGRLASCVLARFRSRLAKEAVSSRAHPRV
jgi:hypothetical protein